MAVGLGPLGQMAASPVQRGTIICNAAISACGKAGERQLAMSIFAEMAESTVQQNAISCNAAISACGRGCEWQSALGLLVRWGLAQCSVVPSLAIPRSALSGRLVNCNWR